MPTNRFPEVLKATFLFTTHLLQSPRQSAPVQACSEAEWGIAAYRGVPELGKLQGSTETLKEPAPLMRAADEA